MKTELIETIKIQIKHEMKIQFDSVHEHLLDLKKENANIVRLLAELEEKEEERRSVSERRSVPTLPKSAETLEELQEIADTSDFVSFHIK